MANKITQQITLTLQGVSSRVSMSGQVTREQAGSNYGEETQTIDNAAATALDIPAAITEGNLGELMIRNLDAANPIDIATDDGMLHKIATVLAGKGNLISPPAGTVALWAKATGAPVQIEFLAIEK